MSAELLVFPVGHDLGPYHPSAGQPAVRHEVRIGRTVYGLPGPAEHEAWLLAHGAFGVAPLTMSRYRDRLRDSGIRNAAEIAGSLAADGLIRRVPPSGEGAVEFARQHRVMPLMTGIGIPDQSRPGRYAIGVFGRPMTYVDEIGYWLWLHGHRWDDLWLASTALAETQPGESTGEPAASLTLILTRLHQLLSASAAYLDASWDRR